MSFDDVDQAVKDIHWAKEHGLGGMMMPALLPGGKFFFDPALDPVWAACVETGLPISQHGGAGTPAYDPPGFAALMTLAIEHSFFSGRSLWQMILGGVFERFPDLRMVFVETEVHWMAPVIQRLDERLGQGDDWLAFSRFMQRERSFSKLASEYWATNCYAGISPFTPIQIPMDTLVGHDEAGEPIAGFHIGADRSMFGVDYPHFETIFSATMEQVGQLLTDPCVTESEARQDPLRERGRGLRLRPHQAAARHRPHRFHHRRGDRGARRVSTRVSERAGRARSWGRSRATCSR